MRFSHRIELLRWQVALELFLLHSRRLGAWGSKAWCSAPDETCRFGLQTTHAPTREAPRPGRLHPRGSQGSDHQAGAGHNVQGELEGLRPGRPQSGVRALRDLVNDAFESAHQLLHAGADHVAQATRAYRRGYPSCMWVGICTLPQACRGRTAASCIRGQASS